ncbi:MAG: AraC family transcriptional regulator ligand-binding domain-containing protein [Deltaproteobacteria bacterium]|nr:AraC family transcriptional regulator ligand-binding domain-containing protein [Deltaproteobacteria bacterium]
MADLVLPVATRAVVEACRRLGLDTGRLLAEAGIEPASLADPDARLPTARADALWEAAYRAARSEHLALEAAEATPFGAFRVLDYLGATGPTLGEGIRLVARYFPLVDPRGRLHVEERPRAAAIRFTAAAGVELPRPAQEYTLAVLLGRARHAAARPLRAAAVAFTFPRPAGGGPHARVFGVEPRFEAPAAELCLARDDWERPTGMTDPGLFAVLGEHLRALAGGAAGDDLLSRARGAIAADLRGQAPTLAATARRLALSARTLQRRLEAAGTSHARLLAEVRRARAEALLRAGDVSVAEVSWLLGFSEQSAFTRAFRRWTGRAPTAFRAAER